MTNNPTNSTLPAEQAIRVRVGRNGKLPPIHARFKPGQSGNPAGRPRSAGLTLREWINEFQESPVEELEAVASDSAAPVAKRAAASLWVSACSADYRESGQAVDRIFDRTLGKPRQAVEVSAIMTDRMENKDKGTFDYAAFKKQWEDYEAQRRTAERKRIREETLQEFGIVDPQSNGNDPPARY